MMDPKRAKYRVRCNYSCHEFHPKQLMSKKIPPSPHPSHPTNQKDFRIEKRDKEKALYYIIKPSFGTIFF